MSFLRCCFATLFRACLTLWASSTGLPHSCIRWYPNTFCPRAWCYSPSEWTGNPWPALVPKALIAMLAGTAGIMIGGPVALWLVGLISPQTVAGQGADAVWRGLATIAGSWIGGGANQTALREVFHPSDTLFSQMVAVDVLVAELWMAASDLRSRNGREN
jgi:hypothetical protein